VKEDRGAYIFRRDIAQIAPVKVKYFQTDLARKLKKDIYDTEPSQR
jgi:hypothetical protein